MVDNGGTKDTLNYDRIQHCIQVVQLIWDNDHNVLKDFGIEDLFTYDTCCKVIMIMVCLPNLIS